MIVVNATALKASGALTILRQFLDNASFDINNYIVFISDELQLPKYQNIEYAKLPAKGWLNRIYWDSFGLSKYIKKKGIDVQFIISLQNTSVNIDAPQIIYLHQSIPFSDIKLPIMPFSNIKLLLYKHFYSFFIFLYANSKTKFVVQTHWMKNALIDNKVRPDNIFVIRPNIKFPINRSLLYPFKYDNVFLYPASPLSYKNHIIILQALRILKGKKVDYTFEVTFCAQNFHMFDKLVHEYGLINNIRYLGLITYDDLILKYKQCKAVLFPSYLETYGLPLAEASLLGKKILAADLPYARDVLDGYSGVTFIKHDNAEAWAEKINEVLKLDVEHFKSHTLDNSKTWKDFFKLINNE